jgi:hypothetical protein
VQPDRHGQAATGCSPTRSVGRSSQTGSTGDSSPSLAPSSCPDWTSTGSVTAMRPPRCAPACRCMSCPPGWATPTRRSPSRCMPTCSKATITRPPRPQPRRSWERMATPRWELLTTVDHRQQKGPGGGRGLSRVPAGQRLVSARGLEPPRAEAHMALNHARLPIPPRRRGDSCRGRKREYANRPIPVQSCTGRFGCCHDAARPRPARPTDRCRRAGRRARSACRPACSSGRPTRSPTARRSPRCGGPSPGCGCRTRSHGR